MDKPEWDKHLDELNVAISHFSNEEREYTIVQFGPHLPVDKGSRRRLLFRR